MIRLRDQQQADESGQGAQQPRSAIVEPKRKPRASIFGAAPDLTEEELQRRGDAADALWLELVRMVNAPTVKD